MTTYCVTHTTVQYSLHSAFCPSLTSMRQPVCSAQETHWPWITDLVQGYWTDHLTCFWSLLNQQQQWYSTNLWTFQLPGDSCHNIYSICSSNANADGTKAASIWCVGVCANEHHSWVGVVLQDDLWMHENLHFACSYNFICRESIKNRWDKNLMDNSRAWFPEANTILCCWTGQEVVDLIVNFLKRNL